MWIFSKEGFVSVVKDRYCKDGEVVVRARLREDLIAFLEKTARSIPPILEFGHADYRFRAIIRQDDFAVALAHVAMEIDYSNFKNMACPLGKDTERMIAYHNCWDALRRLQEGETFDIEGGGDGFPFWDGETEGEA
jgi:hypothetical protein